ncbi:hypothetical protein [Novipirellula rosea]|uniref:hypothetical protein n=1 Tax=Novipirellula rosea TaxID=1031540 RepID=UPI0031F1919B
MKSVVDRSRDQNAGRLQSFLRSKIANPRHAFSPLNGFRFLGIDTLDLIFSTAIVAANSTLLQYAETAKCPQTGGGVPT